MAITAYKYVSANTVAKLNAAIATEIAASRYPVGAFSVRPLSSSPALFEVGQGIGTGATALTAYIILQGKTLTDLQTQVTAAIAAGNLPIGGVIAWPLVDGGYNGNDLLHAAYFQAVGH